MTHESKREALCWRRRRPTEEGTYLRCNPAVTAFIRQHIYEVDGTLWVAGQEGSARVSRQSETFLWLGPIHGPTEDERDRALRKAVT